MQDFHLATLAGLPLLLIYTNALRILSTVLAGAIIFAWTPSVWRLARHAAIGGDIKKAVWIPLAIAVLIYEVRYFAPGLSVLARDRVGAMAHSAMTGSLLFAIYVHGRHLEEFRVRRALTIHATMLCLCIGIATVLR